MRKQADILGPNIHQFAQSSETPFLGCPQQRICVSFVRPQGPLGGAEHQTGIDGHLWSRGKSQVCYLPPALHTTVSPHHRGLCQTPHEYASVPFNKLGSQILPFSSVAQSMLKPYLRRNVSMHSERVNVEKKKCLFSILHPVNMEKSWQVSPRG